MHDTLSHVHVFSNEPLFPKPRRARVWATLPLNLLLAAGCSPLPPPPRTVYNFSTVEAFWQLFNNIRPPSAFSEASATGTNVTYFLFKSQVQPKWEVGIRCAPACLLLSS